MKVLLDVNIVLDVLLNRAPWVADSAAAWNAHRAGEIVAHVAAFTDRHSVAGRRPALGVVIVHGAIRRPGRGRRVAAGLFDGLTMGLVEGLP